MLKDVLGMVTSNAKAAARTKSMATMSASCLVNSTWVNQVVAEWNGLSWSKKGEQALIVPQQESLVLELFCGVGQLRGLLLPLL